MVRPAGLEPATKDLRMVRLLGLEPRFTDYESATFTFKLQARYSLLSYYIEVPYSTPSGNRTHVLTLIMPHALSPV